MLLTAGANEAFVLSLIVYGTQTCPFSRFSCWLSQR